MGLQDGHPPGSGDRAGLSLRLLVLLSLGACAVFWVARQLEPVPLTPPPPPAPTAAPPTATVLNATAAPPPPRSQGNPEHSRLLLPELVAGILELGPGAPAFLRLSPAQLGRLRGLEPRLRARLRANVRERGPEEDELLRLLTDGQKDHLVRLFQARRAPRDLAPLATALHRLLEGTP